MEVEAAGSAEGEARVWQVGGYLGMWPAVRRVRGMCGRWGVCDY